MTPTQTQRRFSLALTGASGVVYGVRLLTVLAAKGCVVDLMVSESGAKCLQLEMGLPGHPRELVDALGLSREQVRVHERNNIASPLASGSALAGLSAGIIMPCSMGTCARIAQGISSNLIERHADVLIKERKPFVLVPRETPLSPIHLENLLKLSRLGCHVVPASPGFYHRPEKVEDLVDHVVGKVLDIVGVEHDLYKRWQGF